MPTNLRRKIIASKKLGSLQISLYDTGALYVHDTKRARQVFALTNAGELYKTKYFKKLIALLNSSKTQRLQARFSAGISLEFSPKMSDTLKFILDSELQDTGKLAYVISVLHNSIAMPPKTLTTIFQVRPEPLEAIEKLFPPLTNVTEETMLRHSIFPDFQAPHGVQLHYENRYREYCLTVSFLSSHKSVTYSDFLKVHEQDFFIPAYPRSYWGSPNLYAPVNLASVGDLRPAEFERFMRYFNKNIVRELRWWARSRFDSGVETIRELQDKGFQTSHLMSSTGWRSVILYLTESESVAFLAFAKKHNGIGKLYRGADEAVASLIAFYWVVGGPDKLSELALHMANSQLGHQSNEGPLQGMTLSWNNPFAATKKRRPDLMPYVKALTNPDFKSLPLEWALASY